MASEYGSIRLFNPHWMSWPALFPYMATGADPIARRSGAAWIVAGATAEKNGRCGTMPNARRTAAAGTSQRRLPRRLQAAAISRMSAPPSRSSCATSPNSQSR